MQPLGVQQNLSGIMEPLDVTWISQSYSVLSLVAVKLVKFPLGSTNKVKVKSSPLIVKFIGNSFKDSPVDVRVVLIVLLGSLKTNMQSAAGATRCSHLS